MTQDDKTLLLVDLCARLPYGVKILHTGWDSDGDTDFDTIETLIGIDDRFIYTVCDKTSGIEKHCLSVSNWKPFLRPLSSMTEEEWDDFNNYSGVSLSSASMTPMSNEIDWLNAHHFDHRGLIERKLAIAVTEENNPYKQ